MITRHTNEDVKNLKRTPVIVVLDNIRSALNVGAIFRTCDAVLVEKLYLCGITAYPPHNKIPKTAIGATDVVPWEYNKSTIEIIEKLKNKNYKIVSVEISKGSKNYTKYNYEKPTAIVLGHEIHGVSQEVINLSDQIVELPMLGRAQSLNVATTTGIVLYEMLRQWNIN